MNILDILTCKNRGGGEEVVPEAIYKQVGVSAIANYNKLIVGVNKLFHHCF